ncbi:hypothetical protein HHI36_000802 [Cryptolaemus montrouzieri]|uniref:Phospholipid/glycerol acyltransferase domain-containing protein n=1 Tax=Cryptolaemus montrouzieri TaxID=559131 RepID=A0ABD2P5Y5_9CUCU
MERKSRNYEDVLEPRRSEFSHVIWFSRKLDTRIAYTQKDKPTPETLKKCVLKDIKISELIDGLHAEEGIPKDILETQVRIILDEIGYNKNLRIIRFLALVLVKICLKVCKGIYVNTNSIFHIKSLMGKCPVIFVPSHRSYADFILMSYICFTYDIEIPAIAAGMDFHGMWAMGSILRDTGAFFMRRSYNSDILYWTTFKQYIQQLVTKGDLAIEFFIEGTRSRSNKSLMPKYGLLNMILKPLFLREVPDILFVPINISYDRIMEEKLFAFELLGVPKPKETTSAFFKSLSMIKEKYGSIHLSFGKPISAKQFFGEYLDESRHSIGPLHHQELNEYDKMIIPSLAHEIIYSQQKLAVLNMINLIALLLNLNLTKSKKLLSVKELKEKVMQLKAVLEQYGAHIWITDFDDDFRETLLVHKNLLHVTGDGKIDVVKNKIDLTNLNVSKLKAYRLSEKVLTYSVPFITLCIYANPVLHYLVDTSIILAVLKVIPQATYDVLFNQYCYLRRLFLHEFVTYPPKFSSEFKISLNHCIDFSLITISKDNRYMLWENEDLQQLMISSIQPFLYSYFIVAHILENHENGDEKSILTMVQEKIVSQMELEFIHPYSLNLDSISHCLTSLSASGALKKTKGTSGFSYIVHHKNMEILKKRLEPYTSILCQGQTIQESTLKHKF